MIDLYRWKIMSGEVEPGQYQSEWENLMRSYQGIVRPFPSGPGDFDAGSKYHVPANVPYVRYFGAAIIQFQLHGLPQQYIIFVYRESVWRCGASRSALRLLDIWGREGGRALQGVDEAWEESTVAKGDV